MNRYDAIKIFKSAASGVTGPYGGYKSKVTSVGGVPTFRPHGYKGTGTVQSTVAGRPTLRGKGAPGPSASLIQQKNGKPYRVVGIKAQQEALRRRLARGTAAPKPGPVMPGVKPLAPPTPTPQVAASMKSYNPTGKGPESAPRNPAPKAVPPRPKLAQPKPKSEYPELAGSGYTPEMKQMYKDMTSKWKAGDRAGSNMLAKEFNKLKELWRSNDPSEQAIEAHKIQAKKDLSGLGDRLSGNFLGGPNFKKRMNEVAQAGLSGAKAKNSLKPYESAHLKKYMDGILGR